MPNKNSSNIQSAGGNIKPPKKNSLFSFLNFLRPKSAKKIPKGKIGGTEPPRESKPISSVRPPSIRKNPKKKLLIIIMLLLLVTVIVLAAVVLMRGRPESAVGERGKLVWWGQREAELVQPLIDEFEDKNPDVKIEYRKQDPIDYRERLQNLIEKGEAPDIYSIHNTWLPMFRNHLDTLPSNIMNSQELSNIFYPSVAGGLTTSTGIMGMPLGYDSLVLFINQDMFSTAFAEPPETWDDYKELATYLTDETGSRIIQSGAAMSLTENVDHWEEIVSLLLIQNGVNLNRPVGDRAEQALIYYTSFSKRGIKVWDETFPDSVLAFANGKLAMLIAPSYRANELRRLNPSLRFAVVPVPQVPQAEPGSPKTTYATFWFEGVWNRSVNSDLAWKFLEFMIDRDSQVKFAENYSSRGLVPEAYPRKDMLVLQKEDPVLGPVVSLGESSYSWFMAGNTKDGDGGISSEVASVYASGVQRIFSGGRNVTDGLSQQVQTVLTKYGIAGRTQLPRSDSN